MKVKFSLNRSQLKIIAIISMVIDHVAWGFVDFYSPLGQFLHVCGRFTIPIMCFFVAEGFRKTHDIKKYLGRMASAAVISIIPFYLFFGEEYGYRQNIIFDYLLGLLMLTVLEKSNFKKWQKYLLVALLFAVSATVGGWIITPSVFILAFYYGRTFAEKAKWFIIGDLVTVGFLVVAISLNSIYHFAHYDWVWWDKFYLLGFMLALPLLYVYNGEKGSKLPGNTFYYWFYPVHFIVLVAIKALTIDFQGGKILYLGLHIVLLVSIIFMLEAVLRTRTSRGQNAIVFFMVTGMIYVVGFIVEILSTTAEGYYLACLVQYFGEFALFISVIFFVSECSLIQFPRFVYLIHIVISMALEYTLINTRETGFFYSYIGVDDSGTVLRPILVHSTGFYLTIVYMVFVCLEVLGIALYIFKHGSDIEIKRMRLILWALIFCWVPYGITLTGITGGYEIPAVGIFIAGVLLYNCFFNYGTLDSVALASENAIDKAHEGMLVVDDRYHISFHNRIVDEILGDIPHNIDIRQNEQAAGILKGEIEHIEVGDKIYEVSVEELKKGKYSQGFMIWFLDVTEHLQLLDNAREMAHHDALTGLYNRSYFKELVDIDVSEGRKGSFLMMDMDNFKLINDRYGHQRGDSVLKNLAKILSAYPEDEMYACRVGGDEFCAYLRDRTDTGYVESVISEIMEDFNHTFRANDEVKCTISVGAVIND
ncbi:MAG: diguanylate cyclase [Lachnospiraceae bacterium]|nr:diguanylate cyclase [Lachnospiraceae bacterium]